MATAFRRKGTHVVGRLTETERGLVVELLSRTHDLVAPTGEQPTGDVFTDLMASLEGPDPDEVAQRDSALRRLLPDGNREDPEIASEFRRFTEDGLRRRKAARLRAAAEALEAGASERGSKITLEVEQAQELMIALTDVRLVLGDRVGLRTEEDAEQLQERVERADGIDDPVVVLMAYYDFLSWMQETLAQAVTH